jgi:hypothetical protein
MKLLSILPNALRRTGLLTGLLLLGGCVAPERPVLEVASPPAPRIGSAPIAAYDAYARALFSPADGSETLAIVAIPDGPPVLPQPRIGETRPIVVIPSILH